MHVGLYLAALAAAQPQGPAPAPPPPAKVAPPPQAGAADPETYAAALALFEGIDLHQQLLSSVAHAMSAAVEVQIEALRKRGMELPPPLLQKLQVLLAEEGQAMVADIEPDFASEAAAVYARHFTAAELRELKRLKENPVMQKAERIAPLLMSELAKIGLAASAERQPEFMRKVETLVQQWLDEQQLHAEAPET